MVTWDSFAQGVSPNHFTRTVDLSRRAGADALSFLHEGIWHQTSLTPLEWFHYNMFILPAYEIRFPNP